METLAYKEGICSMEMDV